MTDQADTGPIGVLPAPVGIKSGCFGGDVLTDEHAFIDWAFQMRDRAAALADEIRELRAELSACRDWQAKRVVAISQDPMCIRWLRQSEQAEEDAAQAEFERDAARAEVEQVRESRQTYWTALLTATDERDTALAELAAARDREAALANIARQLMHGLTPKAEAERLIAAALSQSGQPTKETDHA